QTQIALKNRVWKLKTLSKIRIFLWRAVSGALAVADHLRMRGIEMDAACKLCTQGSETINHVLLRCDMATQILISAEIIWSVWKNKNAIVLANTQDTVESIVQRTTEEASIWSSFNLSERLSTSNRGARHSLSQRCPPLFPGTIKCNIHANWHNRNLHSGGSWIVRDHTGNVIFHAKDAFTRSPNRLIAELRCMVWSLQSITDLRFTDVIISSDLQPAIDAIYRPLEWPRYRALTTLFRNLSYGFERCSFEVNNPKSNFLAREIAKSVSRQGLFQSYLASGGPSWLQDHIRYEANVSN
ncbi:unnamed protein product, partial [Thlaspi arvense]